MEERDYSALMIKQYRHWSVYLHENQSYLGRCVIWCHAKDAQELTDATLAEQQELFVILRNLKEAIKTTFHPDWFNYTFLGNEIQHLHCHVIPRYAQPRMFMSIEFRDEFFGHNYKTDHAFVTPSLVRAEIKDRIACALC